MFCESQRALVRNALVVLVVVAPVIRIVLVVVVSVVFVCVCVCACVRACVRACVCVQAIMETFCKGSTDGFEAWMSPDPT